MQKNKNIRLTDIARMANVSVGTVDRVIHNRGRVSEENIRRVKEIMEQVGYKPNLIARSLAVKKPCHLVLHKLHESLNKLSVQERMEKYQLKPDRADVIVPAGNIFLTIADIIHATHIYVRAPRMVA